MASIVLKTFKGGNVSPLNDAIMWQTAIPGAGIFKGCEVTAARGNILHISQGYGIIKGRFFEVYENEVSVNLAETGQTLNGRVYIHMDLSNADEPIKIIAETAETLSSLLMDANVNYNNSSYDLELAVFKVDAAGIINLTQTFPSVQGGSGGGGGNGSAGIMRDTAYEEGDIVTCANAPGWAILVCTQRGATAIAEPVGYTQIRKGGDMVLDGTAVFTARDLIDELNNITLLQDDVSELSDELEAIKSDTDAVVIKVMSLDAYKALSSYQQNAIYYCYNNETSREIVGIYLGEHTVYATGIQVKYHIDTDTIITRTKSLSNDALADPPVAALSGYTFVGWRDDDTPSKTVLTTKVIDTENEVNLYAVFKRPIEIGMLDNGATLKEGAEEETFEDMLYYNNGNGLSEGITIPECPYEWEGKVFCGWNTDSYSDPTYEPGSIGKFSDDSYLFPMFTDAEYEFPYTGTYFPFTIPATGIYEFELFGASGGNATGTLDNASVTAKGGKGGHVKAYKKMNKGELIYICNGGLGQTSQGFNGGGNGYTYSSGQRHVGAPGGGATHIAKELGVLGSSQSGNNVTKSLTYQYKDNILLVAGGGGGGGISMSEMANTSGAVNGGYSRGPHDGGHGGGEKGGDGSGGNLGGRQTSTGMNVDTNFGKAPIYSGSSISYSGGGGGWFGGNYGTNGNSGGGGSGYVGGMPAFTYKKKYYRNTNEAGINEGNGHSYIRYVQCAL